METFTDYKLLERGKVYWIASDKYNRWLVLMEDAELGHCDMGMYEENSNPYYNGECRYGNRFENFTNPVFTLATPLEAEWLRAMDKIGEYTSLEEFSKEVETYQLY